MEYVLDVYQYSKLDKQPNQLIAVTLLLKRAKMGR